MSKSVTSTEARDNLGNLLRYTTENNEEVVIKLRGEPAAVLISYKEFEEIKKLRQHQKRLQALEKLRALRARIQARITDLDKEDAYRIAGFGEEAIQDIIQYDRHLTELEK